MTSWLLRPAPRPHARARVFCFPNAGVGGSMFRAWSAGLPPELEVCAVQLPGRENRLAEPALRDLPALIAAVTAALEPSLDRAFAFFGHSMGAVLAAEVARALAERGGPRPAHVFVSARRPPHVPGPETPLHPLPDRDFIAEVDRRYGGIRPEVLAHDELMALLLPTLRADITALETYLPRRRAPLACPITAFGGADDALTPRDHLEAWRGETTAAFRVRVFAGGHFYLEPRRAEVLADLAATLAPISGDRSAGA